MFLGGSSLAWVYCFLLLGVIAFSPIIYHSFLVPKEIYCIPQKEGADLIFRFLQVSLFGIISFSWIYRASNTVE